MKKKICLVSLNGTGNTGGVERVSYYLEQILSEQYDVKIVTKGKISFGKADKLLYPILIALKLAFMPHTIVISNSWHSFFYPADISIHHGTTAGSMKVLHNTFPMKVNAFMEKISAQNSKIIVAVSENCKNELKELYNIPEEKIKAIPNFVDENIFYPICSDKTEDNLKKGTITVLFSGTLCDRKGLSYLLKLAEYFDTWNKNVENTNKPFIKMKIATNNNGNANKFKEIKSVQIQTGLTVNDMNSFYNSGDVLFFPSLYEGFSMATLEALSAGIPVIGTKAAIPEELDDFDFCHLITDETPEKIIEFILDMTNRYNDKHQMIHDETVNRFGKTQYRNKFLEIVEHIS